MDMQFILGIGLVVIAFLLCFGFRKNNKKN